jgi:hypothetical protein
MQFRRQLELDESLERRMPDHPIIGKFGIGNLRIETRLDPCRVRLLERLGQRRRRPRQWLQGATDFPSGLAVPSRPNAADIAYSPETNEGFRRRSLSASHPDNATIS